MLHSYFVKYNIFGYSFDNPSEHIIYTNKKILTNEHIAKVEDEMFEQKKKSHSREISFKINSISYLGEISEQEADDDEYAVYFPINL